MQPLPYTLMLNNTSRDTLKASEVRNLVQEIGALSSNTSFGQHTAKYHQPTVNNALSSQGSNSLVVNGGLARSNELDHYQQIVSGVLKESTNTVENRMNTSLHQQHNDTLLIPEQFIGSNKNSGRRSAGNKYSSTQQLHPKSSLMRPTHSFRGKMTFK